MYLTELYFVGYEMEKDVFRVTKTINWHGIFKHYCHEEDRYAMKNQYLKNFQLYATFFFVDHINQPGFVDQ